MKKEKKINNKAVIFLVATILLIALLCLPRISAANIGLSPASLYFKEVLRGGYAEKTITLSTDSQHAFKLNMETRGEIAEWINFSELNFSLSKNIPLRTKITINPPSDIPNGIYEGFVQFTTPGLGDGEEGELTGVVKAALDLAIQVEIVDDEIVECRAYDFASESVEAGENLIFKLKIENNGNIRLKPKVIASIWDKNQINLIKTEEFVSSEILPTSEKELLFNADNNLDLGQFWVEVSAVECYSSQLLTFDVLEPGSLKADGVLAKILVANEAKLGETIKLEAHFKNTGEKGYNAQFRGQITLGERVIQILESDKLFVPASEDTNFVFYFTPKKAGKYIASGRVFYMSKKTFEVSNVIDILSDGLDFSKFVWYLVYAVIIFSIFFLVYKIRKEREKYRNKLRSVK